MLRESGRVLLDGAAEYTRDSFDLPRGDLHIAGVDMHGTLVDPKELAPLSKLTGLREMYLPARVWSPASDIKAPYSDDRALVELARLRSLKYLDVQPTKVTCEGVRALEKARPRIAILSAPFAPDAPTVAGQR